MTMSTQDPPMGTTGTAGRQDAGEKARTEASRAAQDLRGKAEDTARTAAGEARNQAEGAKDRVASEVSSVASAFRKAADEMRDGSPQERTMGQIASGLADASEALQAKDLGDLTRDLGDFARRNPAVFLGGAALVGFAATRFMKASQAPSGRDEPTSYGSGSGYQPGGYSTGTTTGATTGTTTGASAGSTGGYGGTSATDPYPSPAVSTRTSGAQAAPMTSPAAPQTTTTQKGY